MPNLTTNVMVCDQCGGVIPASAPCYFEISAHIRVANGSVVNVGGFVFCCTEHAMARLTAALYPIPTPNPPYPVYTPPA